MDDNDLGLLDCIPKASEFQPVQCIAEISISKFNSFLLNRKMSGDLLYINVITLEGDSIEITCNVSGFFVNCSTNLQFLPSKNGTIHQTLYLLISAISPLFIERLAIVETEKTKIVPFTFFKSKYCISPWHVKSREHVDCVGNLLNEHLVAAEKLETLCYRDWNEDIQGAAEIHAEFNPDLNARDQGSFKAYSDFLEAATKGALLIMNESILPLNSATDQSPIYIHNNIFYSSGYDNEDHFEMYGGSFASHVAVGKDIQGIKMLSRKEIKNLYTIGTAVFDIKGFVY
jgi:protein TIF31